MDKTASTAARDLIAQQAETAVANQKWSRLRFIGNRFERARCYRDCWFALAQGSEATTHHQLPIWPGPDVSCSGVLVLPSTRDLGDELRILRFIGDLKAHIAKVVVLTDPRLHPLLERSFPGVICCDPSESPPHAQLSHMAAQERLAYWFGSDDQQLQGNFRPLTAAGTPKRTQEASASAGLPNRETRPCLPSKTGHQSSKTSANHCSRCNIWKNQHGSEHSAN